MRDGIDRIADIVRREPFHVVYRNIERADRCGPIEGDVDRRCGSDTDVPYRLGSSGHLEPGIGRARRGANVEDGGHDALRLDPHVGYREVRARAADVAHEQLDVVRQACDASVKAATLHISHDNQPAAGILSQQLGRLVEHGPIVRACESGLDAIDRSAGVRCGA